MTGDSSNEEDAVEEELPIGNNVVASCKENRNERRLEFPKPFYCPITKKVMKDPVVLASGLSYERSAIENNKRDLRTEQKFYSNKALQAVIENVIETASASTSIRDEMKYIQCVVENGFTQMHDESFLSTEQSDYLPDEFYCPITCSIMRDPVIDPEGQTYERVAIENWVNTNGSSPLTRNPLVFEDIYPNYAIKDLLLVLELIHADEDTVRHTSNDQGTGFHPINIISPGPLTDPSLSMNVSNYERDPDRICCEEMCGCLYILFVFMNYSSWGWNSSSSFSN